LCLAFLGVSVVFWLSPWFLISASCPRQVLFVFVVLLELEAIPGGLLLRHGVAGVSSTAYRQGLQWSAHQKQHFGCTAGATRLRVLFSVLEATCEAVGRPTTARQAHGVATGLASQAIP
jgi:hypothetical protein